MTLSVFSRSGVQESKNLALDRLVANVMIADAELTIRYMNPALVGLLQEAESDLKKELPRFSVANLIGSNIDVFHKNPSHQRNMLSTMRAEHKATIWIGDRAFDLRVMPIMKGSKRTGFVVEWMDAKQRITNFDYAAQIEAIYRWQAVIEFTPNGTITTANENFLKCVGYSMDEIRGRHHSMFMVPADRNSDAYKRFWEALGRGEYQSGEFKRSAKGGADVWIQGSYNPILDTTGKVVKVIKFALDVTRRVEAVSNIGGALSGLAGGDLAHRIDRPLTPELDKLRLDFNSAVETLQAAMQKVDHSARTIDGSTAEIRTSSADLSRRTEQQAASLEETAAALDEITATVRATADGAKQARSIVSNAKVNAEQSGRVVQQAVDAMGGIEKSSREISQIIGVIDEIAFQTNLLALNAGVEAARAGDAGRGFAVVASEVRALAQRSAEAAKQIKTLISSSGDQVQQGVALVGQTGESLNRLVTQVSEIDGIVGEITSSAEEQARGLGEVNAAVNQMDQVTQQNAAMVEEATAASHELAKETSELGRLVGQFNIGGQAYAPVRAVSAARPASSAQTPVRALRTVGRGGAARALEPAAGQEWTEF